MNGLRLLGRFRNDGWLPSKDILKKAQEVDDIRTLIHRPIAQIWVVDSAIDADVLTRTYSHSLSRYNKDHDTFGVCRIGMR
jgi:hypothetical protein